jgi:hypothetical protein
MKLLAIACVILSFLLMNCSDGEKKMDIDRLLESRDINQSIIELDNYITELCNYGENMEKLTDAQKIFYINQNLEREVNNGGFNQYFHNSSGDFAHETIDALKTIGAIKTASILQAAIDQFPNKIVPKERDKRINILEQIEGRSDSIWEDLDQQFFKYEEDLNQLNIEFVRQHKENF